jgi:acyl-coenzyme A thioesterase PaaI-like protein
MILSLNHNGRRKHEVKHQLAKFTAASKATQNAVKDFWLEKIESLGSQILPRGEKLLDFFEHSKRIPGGKKMLSRYMGKLIPYTGSMPFEIEELSSSHSVVSFQEERKIRNHLNCIHAIALANLGEFSTGALCMARVKPNENFILVNLEIDYLKKARGKISAKCQPSEAFLTENWVNGGTLKLESNLFDSKNILVSRVRATWKIRVS